MTKVLSVIALVLAIAVLAIALLKMSGQGELVENAGGAIVQTLGLEDKDGSTSAFVKNALGWDITEIGRKPLSTVKAGKARLQKVIDRLEDIRLKNKVATAGAAHKKSETQEEMQGLLDSIHAAQAHLKDPAAAYPVTIKGFGYSSREQLQSAAAKAIRRYQTLKRALPLATNNPAYGEAQTVSIEKQLDTAYQIMELLGNRLALAEMQEYGLQFDEANKKLAALEATATAIITDGEAAVQQLPAGYTSGSDRDANTVDSFTE